MSRGSRGRNERLLAIIRTCGWSYDACAKAIRAVAKETGDDLSSLHRSLVAYWVAGVLLVLPDAQRRGRAIVPVVRPASRPRPGRHPADVHVLVLLSIGTAGKRLRRTLGADRAQRVPG